ncbi:hypothetical protein B0H17DRAFT_1058998, partial [Mycena rosella]
LDTFECVALSLGVLRGGMSIELCADPPIASLAIAAQGTGIRSHLNYDQAIPSASQLAQLEPTLHLTDGPRWISVPAPWNEADLDAQARAYAASMPPLFSGPSTHAVEVRGIAQEVNGASGRDEEENSYIPALDHQTDDAIQNRKNDWMGYAPEAEIALETGERFRERGRWKKRGHVTLSSSVRQTGLSIELNCGNLAQI